MATSQPYPLGKERERGLTSATLADVPWKHPNHNGPRPAAGTTGPGPDLLRP